MGGQLLDQYSLLHAAVGVVAYFWNVPFWFGVLLHAVFEWAENTATGIWWVNRLFVEPGWFGLGWPGGKREPDALVNRVGDTGAFAVGWLAAAGLDWVGVRRGWYAGHRVSSGWSE